MPEGRSSLHSIGHRVRLHHLLALALALRLVSLAIPAMVHPDEIFQYLEPAHRLLFGRGVVTWEWRAGMRSWLIPVLVAGPMALGAAIDPGGALYLILPKLVMTVASLLVVLVGWRLGDRLSRLHAIAAAAVAAIWYEFVFLAPHILSDTIAVLLVLPAALILVQRERWTDRRLVAAGVLLGLAVTARFQLAPAVAALAVASCGTRVRVGLRPLVLGGAVGLLPGVACDIAMYQPPFAWLVENVRLNLLEGRAAKYGASGPWGFIPMIAARWSLWSVPVLLLAALGARRYPALAWTATVNFGFHMLIAHKEYRFVLLSTTLTILLAAIGSVDWISRVAQGPAAGRRLAALVALGWLTASLGLALGDSRPMWVANRPELVLYARLRDDPRLCGIAIYRHDFWKTGGYTYLHRDVPMQYLPNALDANLPQLLAGQEARFNTVLTSRDHARELPAGFVEQTCMNDGNVPLCTFRRPGVCRAVSGSPTDVNRVLTRINS